MSNLMIQFEWLSLACSQKIHFACLELFYVELLIFPTQLRELMTWKNIMILAYSTYVNLHYIWIWKFYNAFVHFWILLRRLWRFRSIANWKWNTGHSFGWWSSYPMGHDAYYMQHIMFLKKWQAFPVIIAQTTTKHAAIITNTRVEL